MFNLYKIRAVVEYEKDEKGNATDVINEIRPIANVPFVGDVDSKNEWYIIKTPVELTESEDIILIKDDGNELDEKTSALFDGHKVSIEMCRNWGFGGAK